MDVTISVYLIISGINEILAHDMLTVSRFLMANELPVFTVMVYEIEGLNLFG